MQTAGIGIGRGAGAASAAMSSGRSDPIPGGGCGQGQAASRSAIGRAGVECNGEGTLPGLRPGPSYFDFRTNSKALGLSASTLAVKVDSVLYRTGIRSGTTPGRLSSPVLAGVGSFPPLLVMKTR
jgi:hypothetical protein